MPDPLTRFVSIPASSGLIAAPDAESMPDPAGPFLAAGLGSQFAEVALNGPMLLAVLVAALAGLVSFLSPCVLPLVPGYVGYVTGLGAGSLQDRRTWRVGLGIGLFILGFAVVFTAFGALAGAAGQLVSAHLDLVTRILGAVVIIAGIVFMGGFGFLQRKREIGARPPAGLWGAPLLGATFGLSWAPCIGPTLAAVLSLSVGFGADASSVWRGAILAFVYCLGLGIPFLLLAVALVKGMGRVDWVRRHQLTIQRIGGGMLILLGLVMASGLWMRWIYSLQGLIDGFWVVI